MVMPGWAQTANWIAAGILGVPGALVGLAVGAFYLFRPRDAAFLGMAGFLALIFAGAALIPAGLFAAAAWGGKNGAGWTAYVQTLALLVGLLPALILVRMVKTAAIRALTSVWRSGGPKGGAR